MSDLNWCTFCDTAISHYSHSLYCSEDCLRADALRNHPLLGYDWHEFVNFPRPYPRNHQQQQRQLTCNSSVFSSRSSSMSLEDDSPSLSSSSSPTMTVSWKSASEMNSLRTSNHPHHNNIPLTAMTAPLGLTTANQIKPRQQQQQQPLRSQLSFLLQSSTTLGQDLAS